MLNFALALAIGRIDPPGEFETGAAVREIAGALEQAGLAFAAAATRRGSRGHDGSITF